jgi:hypothetical protein
MVTSTEDLKNQRSSHTAIEIDSDTDSSESCVLSTDSDVEKGMEPYRYL